MHCSSRANKGNGGQLSQLQAIECIQTERMTIFKSHASQLERATTNEPVNPMASVKPKPHLLLMYQIAMVNQSRSWYITFCNVLDPSTDSRASQAPAGFDSAPPPAYQMAIQGSRYSIRPSDPEKQHGPDGNTFPESLDRGTAPLSHVSVTPLSCKVPIIPVSRDASITASISQCLMTKHCKK